MTATSAISSSRLAAKPSIMLRTSSSSNRDLPEYVGIPHQPIGSKDLDDLPRRLFRGPPFRFLRGTGGPEAPNRTPLVSLR